MKKNLIKKMTLIVLTIITMISFTTIVNAAEVGLNLSAEKEKVEQNTEIKVKLIVKNFTREGTQKAIESKITYEGEKIEYKEIKWKNNWTGSISGDGTGIVGSKSGEVGEEEEIAEITYLVKENATKGKTKIEAKEILTSSDGDEVEASNVQVEIEIIEAGREGGEEPQKPEGNQNGGETQKPQEENKNETQNKDNTSSEKDLPNTGTKVPVFGGIAVMFITAIVNVIKIKRLSGI